MSDLPEWAGEGIVKWFQWHLLRDLLILLAMYAVGLANGYLFLACRIQP